MKRSSLVFPFLSTFIAPVFAMELETSGTSSEPFDLTTFEWEFPQTLKEQDESLLLHPGDRIACAYDEEEEEEGIHQEDDIDSMLREIEALRLSASEEDAGRKERAAKIDIASLRSPSGFFHSREDGSVFHSPFSPSLSSSMTDLSIIGQEDFVDFSESHHRQHRDSGCYLEEPEQLDCYEAWSAAKQLMDLPELKEQEGDYLFRYLCIAAENQFNIKARLALAHCYEHAIGTQRDMRKAHQNLGRVAHTHPFIRKNLQS